MVRAPCFHHRGPRFDPWSGTKIPQAAWHNQKNLPNQNKTNKKEKARKLSLEYPSLTNLRESQLAEEKFSSHYNGRASSQYGGFGAEQKWRDSQHIQQ